MSTLIFAAVAAFVLWKLWSVLGYRTGNERPPVNKFPPRSPNSAENNTKSSNVIRLPGATPEMADTPPLTDKWKGYAEANTPLANGLDVIAARDPNFAAAPFVVGAKAAYEMIVTAFACGDRKTLQNLLAKDVLDSFNTEIDAREARKESTQLTFVSLDKTSLEEAHMQDKSAFITLRFAAKMISVTRNDTGTVTQGSADTVNDHIDIWTFARDTASRDLNWRLVSTTSDN